VIFLLGGSTTPADSSNITYYRYIFWVVKQLLQRVAILVIFLLGGSTTPADSDNYECYFC